MKRHCLKKELRRLYLRKQRILRIKRRRIRQLKITFLELLLHSSPKLIQQKRRQKKKLKKRELLNLQNLILMINKNPIRGKDLLMKMSCNLLRKQLLKDPKRRKPEALELIESQIVANGEINGKGSLKLSKNSSAKSGQKNQGNDSAEVSDSSSSSPFSCSS
ncbi:hypothetical protein LIER_24337 [Lithospermum erythrorhizon]|uniref:Uncharacterized protein n=1 Tax=Lithospermum erythrorhizon TaxID=34254 RepID=A0AAV3R275_LITER